MRRQSSWDRRHLATLSTHVTSSQAEAFRAACRANAVRPYVALRDFVLQYTREMCPKNGTLTSEEVTRLQVDLDQISDAAAAIIDQATETRAAISTGVMV
jgi:hypothetical protein